MLLATVNLMHGPSRDARTASSSVRTPWRTAPAPEPLEWQPEPTARERLFRAVSVPKATAVLTLLAALCIAAVLLTMSSNEPDSLTEDAVSDVPGVGDQIAAAAGLTGSSDLADAPVETQKIVVHVIGEVVSPGIVELDAGARLSEALDAAGGPTSAAALSGVNLARVLSDGEQVAVPNEVELAADPDRFTQPSVAAPSSGGRIHLNSADAATLEQLPRVGPSLAQRIIDWRTVNDGFTSVDQLLDVSGIGQKTLEELRDLVTV
jgi:competence protein ComEA